MSSITIITGAGSGIGQAVARRAAAPGRRLLLVGRRRVGLEATAQQCDGPVTICEADVCAPDAAECILAAARALDGTIDSAFLAAGTFPRTAFPETTLEEWFGCLNVNLLAIVRQVHALLPPMLAQGHGRIVVVGSRLATGDSRRASAYAASKAGLHAFVRALAHDLTARDGHRVEIVEFIPGPTRTGTNPEGQDPEDVAGFAAALIDPTRPVRSGEMYYRGRVIQDYADIGSGRGLIARIRGMAAIGRRQ